MGKKLIIEELLNKKSDTNNTIDLNAYAQGLKDMFDRLGCSQLLERYEEVLEALKVLSSETMKTKQHHNNPSLKKALDNAELKLIKNHNR